MEDERELTVELERERRGAESAPIRLAPDDLEPDTLRAVIESFVLREGTDYGVHETSLEDKVAQVLRQLRRGEAHITFDPATESVNATRPARLRHGYGEVSLKRFARRRKRAWRSSERESVLGGPAGRSPPVKIWCALHDSNVRPPGS
jgi:uncharacterized protein YheU (UPF0270 family)